MKITKVDVFQVNDDVNPIWRPVMCRIYTDVDAPYGQNANRP